MSTFGSLIASFSQTFAQIAQQFVVESGADAAGVNQRFVFRLGQQQGADAGAAAFGFGEADDDEFVRRAAFHFHPVAVARADVARCSRVC